MKTVERVKMLENGGPNFKKVAIIGLGLIGGSLGLAMRNLRLAKYVSGVARRQETICEALEIGAIDGGTIDPASGVKDADLIFIATPISQVIPTIKLIKPYLKNGCLVTDVASTKEEIVKKATKLLSEKVYFVGGHPMAGSEKSGIKSADANLLLGATYVLTPVRTTNQKLLIKLQSFLKRLNVRIVVMSPAKHDLIVAAISHLPYLIATSLVKTVQESLSQNRKDLLGLAAGGFRDTTRVAVSPPIFGRDICLTNKNGILTMLKKFKENLEEMENLIYQNKYEKLLNHFSKTQNFRQEMYRN